MKTAKFLLMTMLVSLLAACGTTRTVPITGRKQNLLISDAEIMSMSLKEYNSYMAKTKKSANATNTAMVQRVGRRLANAVESYLRSHGLSNEVGQYSWEFNLVQDKSANAFCLPGGKIVVYEGLLPYTQSEAALAVVLGHEIAHAVAKHSAEQISKQYRQQYATQIGSSILGAAVGSEIGNIAGVLAQTGFKFRNLKYSRDHETEADHIGLIFAAMAGYDPRVAVPFWQRMAAGNSASQSDVFSDHPSDAKRIAALQRDMPEALKYYQASNKVATTTQSAATAKKKTAKKKTTARKTSARRK
ncbi:M48 family metallopeptidase [Prevotella sp. KH2C16]|uniref:M48 family metallopeptidase n=1 Tax=Prevotella sp. KH2C16 TaxID=1855325 RepID=UPI0008E14330|nr:M48 family metallopeptidase [Prevotella sp. KH2C16]SFG18482.1 Peptidase family M48 [Prevotella sp. KH2C16]